MIMRNRLKALRAKYSSKGMGENEAMKLAAELNNEFVTSGHGWNMERIIESIKWEMRGMEERNRQKPGSVSAGLLKEMRGRLILAGKVKAALLRSGLPLDSTLL